MKLSKGSFVAVQGRLELNEWTQDGQRRQQLRVVVAEVTSPDFFKGTGQQELPVTEVHDPPGPTA